MQTKHIGCWQWVIMAFECTALLHREHLWLSIIPDFLVRKMLDLTLYRSKRQLSTYEARIPLIRLIADFS